MQNPVKLVDNAFVYGVGDILVSSFWPERLGIVRGFLCALDAVHAVTEYDAVTAMASAFSKLKQLIPGSRGALLREFTMHDNLQPDARYKR